jgi:hypothetical protein
MTRLLRPSIVVSLCLAPVPDYSSRKIRALRGRYKLSQAFRQLSVADAVRDVTALFFQQCECRISGK